MKSIINLILILLAIETGIAQTLTGTVYEKDEKEIKYHLLEQIFIGLELTSGQLLM